MSNFHVYYKLYKFIYSWEVYENPQKIISPKNFSRDLATKVKKPKFHCNFDVTKIFFLNVWNIFWSAITSLFKVGKQTDDNDKDNGVSGCGGSSSGGSVNNDEAPAKYKL